MIKRLLLSALFSLPGVRRPLRVYTDELVDSPVEIAEVLSLSPRSMETYHLPLARGAALDIDVVADGPLLVRILDEDTWRTAHTPDARLLTCRCLSVDSGQELRMRFRVPKSGGYMVLIGNIGANSVQALLALRSEPAGNVAALDESGLEWNDDERQTNPREKGL